MGNKSSKKQKLYSVPPNAGRPSACGQPQVDVQDSGIFVHWMGPKNSGGCPIIGYIVQHSELGEGIWHSSSPIRRTECIIENLLPGATYQFRVIGENLLGYAPPSPASEPILYTTELVAPTFITGLSNVAAIENEKVELKVQVTGRPQPIVNWFLNDELLESTEDENIIVEMQRCILKRVSSRFEGEVRCVAYNEMGSDESRAELTVGDPPRINEESSRDLIFQVDELLRVKFTFSGRPEPETNWFHNGVPIRENIETIGSCTTLKIPHATRDDRGEYSLRLENHLGVDSATVLVTVADKPKPPSVPTVVLLKDNSCVLEWNHGDDDGGCPVQCSIIEYFRLGWDVWLTGGTSRANCGKIRDLIPGSKYKFRVKSENLYGLSEPSGTSVEIFIPEMSSGLMSPVEESEEENEKPTQMVVPQAASSTKSLNNLPGVKMTKILEEPKVVPLTPIATVSVPKIQPFVKPDISVQPDPEDEPRPNPTYVTRAELRKSLPKPTNQSNLKDRSPLLFDHYTTPRSPIRSRSSYNSREKLDPEPSKSNSLPRYVESPAAQVKPDILTQPDLTKFSSLSRDAMIGNKDGLLVEHYTPKSNQLSTAGLLYEHYTPKSNQLSRDSAGLLYEQYTPSPTSRSSSVCSAASSHLIYEGQSSEEDEDVSIVTSSSLIVLKSGSCAIKTRSSREELNVSNRGSYESISCRSRNSLTSKDIGYYSSIFGQTTYGDEPEAPEGNEAEIYETEPEGSTSAWSSNVNPNANPTPWTSRWRLLLIPLFLGLFLKFTLYTNVGVMLYVVYRLVKLFFE